MKIIVGLGNPGAQYENTRHNVGFEVVEALAKRIQNSELGVQEQMDWKESKSGQLLYWWLNLGKEKVELVKPQTFMNRSGNAVAYVKKKHPQLSSEDLYVVHDDLDIKLGDYKIGWEKGPKIHRGVNSIEQSLGTKDFWRVRVGVDSRVQGAGFRIEGEKYVLMKLAGEERGVLDKVIDEVVGELVGRLS